MLANTCIILSARGYFDYGFWDKCQGRQNLPQLSRESRIYLDRSKRASRLLSICNKSFKHLRQAARPVELNFPRSSILSLDSLSLFHSPSHTHTRTHEYIYVRKEKERVMWKCSRNRGKIPRVHGKCDGRFHGMRIPRKATESEPPYRPSNSHKLYD